MFRSVLTEAGLFKDVKKRCKEECCGHKSQSRNPEGGDWLLSAPMFCFLSFPITYYLKNKFRTDVIVCKNAIGRVFSCSSFLCYRILLRAWYGCCWHWGAVIIFCLQIFPSSFERCSVNKPALPDSGIWRTPVIKTGTDASAVIHLLGERSLWMSRLLKISTLPLQFS